MKLPIERDWLFIYWKARKAETSCAILVDKLRWITDLESAKMEDFVFFLDLFDDEFNPSVIEWYLLDKYGEQFIFQFYLLFLNNDDFKSLKADVLRTEQIIQTTTEDWESSEKEGGNDWKEEKTTSTKKRRIPIKDPKENTIDLWKKIREIFKGTE